MRKLDVVSLVIEGVKIPFDQCIVNVSETFGGAGDASDGKSRGTVAIYFDNKEASAVVVPYKSKRVSLQFSTETETFECMADTHDIVRYDGRAVCYMVI